MRDLAVLGVRLKKARIAKGLTLDNLQDVTKIQKRYLKGIEEADYSMMPGAFYVRSFIKQYAEAVGLDAEEMVALYQAEYGHAVQEEQEQVTSPVLQRSSGLNKNYQLQEYLPKIIVAFFIVMILVIIYILLRDKAAKPELDNEPINPGVTVIEQPTEQPAEKPAAPVDKPQEPDAKAEVVQKLKHASTVKETSTFTLEDAEQVKLVIATSGDSWISVTDQKGAEMMPAPGGRVMKAGQTVEIDAKDATKIRVRVGRTKLAKLTVNGEAIDYPTDIVTQNIIITIKP